MKKGWRLLRLQPFFFDKGIKCRTVIDAADAIQQHRNFFCRNIVEEVVGALLDTVISGYAADIYLLAAFKPRKDHRIDLLLSLESTVLLLVLLHSLEENPEFARIGKNRGETVRKSGTNRVLDAVLGPYSSFFLE